MSNARTWLAALVLGLGVACIDPYIVDSTDTGGAQGCCQYECSDGSGGWVVADSQSECDASAELTCSTNGLEVTTSSYAECARCEDCF